MPSTNQPAAAGESLNASSLKSLSNRKAVFGILAIVCFCIGVGLCLWGVIIARDNIEAWARTMGASQGQADGWWMNSVGGATCVMFGGLILWLLGLVFAVVSFLRAERPRWPAIVGLVLCAVPLALSLFMLLSSKSQRVSVNQALHQTAPLHASPLLDPTLDLRRRGAVT